MAIRYPRGNGYGVKLRPPARLEAGKAEIMEQGEDGLVIAIGSRVRDALEAVEDCRRHDGRAFSLINLRFIKPLDRATIHSLLRPGKPLVIIEEGVAQGGIGERIIADAAASGWHGPVRHLAMPDAFPEHGSQAEILRDLGLDAAAIRATLSELVHG